MLCCRTASTTGCGLARQVDNTQLDQLVAHAPQSELRPIHQPCLCRTCNSIQITPDCKGGPPVWRWTSDTTSFTGGLQIPITTPRRPSCRGASALFVISSLHYS